MLAPGVEDELLEFAGGRVQQFEDQVAAGDRLQPVGNEAADKHHCVGHSHHRQVTSSANSVAGPMA